MKSVFVLSLLFLNPFWILGTPVANASSPEHHESKAVDLDKEILKYQFDALMCAASPIVARIPGSSHILEASKCALVAGLGATEIIRSLTECAHLRHSKNDRDFLGCLKSGSSYFATNKEALACLLGSSLDKSVKHVLHNLGIVGDIVTCSLTVAQGATLLVDTTKAANAARSDARDSADRLAKTIANLQGSRLYNMGFYRGCLAVTEFFPNDETKCISLCDHQKAFGMGEMGGYLNQKQQAYTSDSCKAGCRASEAVPNSWIYTVLISSEPGLTRKGCEAVVSNVKNTLEGRSKTTFRVLNLPGVNQGSEKERLGALLAWKTRINLALDAIDKNWKSLNSRGGLVSTQEIIALGLDDSDDAKLISSVFGNKDLGIYEQGTRKELPLLMAYLDSTQTGSVDGLIARSDLSAFKEEVSRYYFGD